MKHVDQIIISLALGAACCTSAASQTQINLSSQSRNVDFRNAPSTSPLKSGVNLPITYQTAEMFFKTDAAAGSNIYLCVGTNLWQVVSVRGTHLGSWRVVL